MDKTIDLNEKALENEKKSFLSFCKASHILIIIALCLAIAAVVLSVFVCVVANVSGDDAVAMEKYDLFKVIHSVITYIGFAIALKHGESVFKKLKSGEAPFRYDIADSIKAMGITLLSAAAVGLAADTVHNILIIAGAFGGETSLSVDLGMILCGFVLCALAYVFNYGCKLQQESDETI